MGCQGVDALDCKIPLGRWWLQDPDAPFTEHVTRFVTSRSSAGPGLQEQSHNCFYFYVSTYASVASYLRLLARSVSQGADLGYFPIQTKAV